MKKISAVSVNIIVFCVVYGCALACSAQIAGGYNAASKTDKNVIAAANFAVKTEAKKIPSLNLIAIERAERQVVAGMNFRMCLSVKSAGKTRQATAVVYQNLKNKFSLSEWTNGKCAAGGTNQTLETISESVTYQGSLEVGKTSSTILYLGEESGDYAAFCFANNSAAGRKILAVCKNGGQCEFTGKVDFESSCKVKNLEASLSASGKITSVTSVRAVKSKTRAKRKT